MVVCTVLLNTLIQQKAKGMTEGKNAIGKGLWLVKSDRARGKYVPQVAPAGMRRETGPGSWPVVSIAEVRELAAEALKNCAPDQAPLKHAPKPS